MCHVVTRFDPTSKSAASSSWRASSAFGGASRVRDGELSGAADAASRPRGGPSPSSPPSPARASSDEGSSPKKSP